MTYTDIKQYNSLSIEEMRAVQEELRMRILDTPYGQTPKLVAGVDIAYNNSDNKAVAIIVIMEYETKKLLDVIYAETEAQFQYIPGFLAFRELPLFIEAWEKLTIQPDLIFFDGQGRIHPKRLGLAVHAGILIDKPTIGIAKSRFIGDYDEPENKTGAYSWIKEKDEVLGIVLRSKENCKPVFVSAGHKITLDEAVEFSKHFMGDYRIPEITRIADYYSKKLIKSEYDVMDEFR